MREINESLLVLYKNALCSRVRPSNSTFTQYPSTCREKKPFEKNALKTGGGGVRTSFSSADYANGPSRSAINSDLQRRQNFGKSSPTSAPRQQVDSNADVFSFQIGICRESPSP